VFDQEDEYSIVRPVIVIAGPRMSFTLIPLSKHRK